MKKILLIHDQASIWESLAEALAADGYLVVPISRSALAREMILTLVPDLVLLDWEMDEKDKSDVFEEVKKQAPNMNLLALATDAHSPQGPLRLIRGCIRDEEPLY
jgi:DNA-binding response OmpR family regulator